MSKYRAGPVEVSSFNLKLSKEIRAQFKRVTRERHVTMQAVLASFVQFYVGNPDRVKLKMEVPKWTMEMDVS